MAKMTYDEVVSELRQRKKSLKCKEVCNMLEDLGFTVRKGDGPGHKVFSHSKIIDFPGSNFDCGHGSGPIKVPYIVKLIGTLENWSEEIKAANNPPAESK